MPNVRLFCSATLLGTLSACSSSPSSGPSITVSQDKSCPLELRQGETMVLKLPSDPSSGNRWNLRESSDELLKKLGPEVYSNSEQDPLGGKGTSTWRFQATHPGTGRLLLTYQRPWEVGAEPSGLFDCRIVVK